MTKNRNDPKLASFYRSKLRQLSHHCNALINKAKFAYYIGIIPDDSDNLKALWWVLKGILHRKSQTILPDGSSGMPIANMFCKFLMTRLSKSGKVSPSAVK